MNVGDTRTLSFNAPPYVVGTQWTISDMDAVEFVSTPGSTATSANIKALSPRTAANRCIVHCTYYYRELDPATGRYEYQRTGYQDWEIIIRESGSSGGSDEDFVKDPKIILRDSNTTFISRAEEKILYVDFSRGGNVLTWKVEDPSILRLVTRDNGWNATIGGLKEGKTRVYINNASGAEASCEVIVTKKSYKKGDFIYYTTEYSELGFRILDETEKTCKLNNVLSCQSISGIIDVDSNVYGYDVVTVGSGFLSGNTTVKRVYLPNSIVTIGVGAFSSEKLEFVDLPNSVKSIEGSAFDNCTHLAYIVIPQSTDTIGCFAFYGCRSLTQINIPNSLKSIERNTFQNCTNLLSVNIPHSIISIGDEVFNGCSALTSVYYSAIDPIEGNANIFSDYEKPTLYVPAEAIDKCKTIHPWKNFKKIHAYTFSTGNDEMTDDIDCDKPDEVYNFYGVLLGNTTEKLTPGIYIVRKGNSVKKIAVK